MTSQEIKEVRFLKNIGLLMTYKCQVQCPHCIIQAGPHRTEEISLEDAYDWIRQISAYRFGFIKVLSLTGGEPFFNIQRLKLISDYAKEQDLYVSAVTNGYWASTLEKAIQILDSLPSLMMLQISTDKYHQQSIPFERVKNAMLACNQCNIPYTISICTENENDPEYQETLNNVSDFVDPQVIFTAITFKAGRALQLDTTQNYDTSRTPPVSSCGAGGAPIVFPNGKIMACIGPIIDLKTPHPLILGNLKQNSLEEILDQAELNVVLHAIRIWGPKFLIKLVREAGLESELPKTYIKDSVCHACYELMANPQIVDFLMDLQNDSELVRKVAYARIYYLNEPEMALGLGLQLERG
jgi:MoaA/NifB/PqqE/SkfB family radical SAM enzyme